VLADPPESGTLGDRLFQHRRRVDEHAIAEFPDHVPDPLCQSLQSLAHQLVIVPAERIARDEGPGGIGELLFHIRVSFGEIVHASRNDAAGAGNQLGRPRSQGTVPRHVVHRAVPAVGQPLQQPGLCLTEVDIAYSDLLKAERAAPGLDLSGEDCELGGRQWQGHHGSADMERYRRSRYRVDLVLFPIRRGGFGPGDL